MKNTIKMCGIVVLTAVIGMAVAGCKNNNSSLSPVLDPALFLDPVLFGTWVHAIDGETFTFNENGTVHWVWALGGINETGSWSASGGVITVKVGTMSDSSIYTFVGSNLFMFDEGPYVKQP